MVPQTVFGALASSILPASRSGQVGDTLTAFATIINTGPGTASSCSISLSTALSGTFLYQTTDPATNALTGTPNTPADIAEGASQSFIIAFTPSAPLVPTDAQFNFSCINTAPAATISGVNTLLLSVSSTPVPDVIALATGNGIVDIPAATGAAALAVATVNVGSTGSITASADTGSAVLPVGITVCETNPATGVCMNPTTPASSATTTIGPGATPTFAFFLTGSGPIALDPANSRMFARFTDAGQVVRGATSVALTSSVVAFPDVTGTYTGTGTITSTGCINPIDNITVVLGLTVSIPAQSSQNFNGTFFVDPASLPPGDAINGTLNGTINAQGAVNGTMTANSFFNGMLDTASSGTFSGSLSNNTLSFQISLQDTFGDTCMSTGPITVSR